MATRVRRVQREPQREQRESKVQLEVWVHKEPQVLKALWVQQAFRVRPVQQALRV